MPTFLQRFSAAVQKMIPTQRVTHFSDRYAPPVLAQSMDVDRVHSLIEGAVDGDTRELFALYREIVLTDSHLQNEFGKRKLAVLGDALSIQPRDKKDKADVQAQEAVEAMIEGLDASPAAEEDAPRLSGVFDGPRGWEDACIHLLDSTVLPVAVLEKVFRPSTQPGLRYELAELVPVPDQLLDYTTGAMRLRATDPKTGALTAEFVDLNPNRYIVHRGHLLTSRDNRGGPMRALIFWWLFSNMTRDWWARYLDKYGSPFLLGRYDQADDASRGVLQQAFMYATRLGGLVVSKQTEVEVVQAAAAQSGEAYERFLAICQKEKSKLILGQTLSSTSEAQGMGNGASDQQEEVRQDIRQWDAARLGKTLRAQLFRQFLEINGLKGRAPLAVWGGESPEAAQATGTLLAALKNAGLSLTDAGIETLSERIGMTLQRDTPPPALLGPGQERDGMLPLSARLRLFSAAPSLLLDAEAANDEIARRGSAELAQAFRGALAPVRRMIEESTSAEDLQAKLVTAYADWPVSRVAGIIEQALIAYASNRVVGLA